MGAPYGDALHLSGQVLKTKQELRKTQKTDKLKEKNFNFI